MDTLGIRFYFGNDYWMNEWIVLLIEKRRKEKKERKRTLAAATDYAGVQTFPTLPFSSDIVSCSFYQRISGKGAGEEKEENMGRGNSNPGL